MISYIAFMNRHLPIQKMPRWTMAKSKWMMMWKESEGTIRCSNWYVVYLRFEILQGSFEWPGKYFAILDLGICVCRDWTISGMRPTFVPCLRRCSICPHICLRCSCYTAAFSSFSFFRRNDRQFVHGFCHTLYLHIGFLNANLELKRKNLLFALVIAISK